MFVFQHGFPVGFLVVFVFQAGFRPLSTHCEYEVLQIFDLGQIHVVQPPTQALIMGMKFNSTFLSIQNQCTSYSEINFFLDLLSLWLCGVLCSVRWFWLWLFSSFHGYGPMLVVVMGGCGCCLLQWIYYFIMLFILF